MNGFGLADATQRVAEHARSLVELEVQLATAELKRKARRSGWASGSAAGRLARASWRYLFGARERRPPASRPRPAGLGLPPDRVRRLLLIASDPRRWSASRCCDAARSRCPSRRLRRPSDRRPETLRRCRCRSLRSGRRSRTSGASSTNAVADLRERARPDGRAAARSRRHGRRGNGRGDQLRDSAEDPAPLGDR